jgi:hypothetical protein
MQFTEYSAAWLHREENSARLMNIIEGMITVYSKEWSGMVQLPKLALHKSNNFHTFRIVQNVF